MKVLPPPRRILVVRLNSLGDIILMALLIRRLKERHPECELDALVRDSYLPVLEAMPWLDNRLALSGTRRSRSGLKKRLRERGYDVVVDLQNNIRSRRITGMLKCRRVYRFHRLRWNRSLRIHLPGLRSRLSVPPPVALQYLNVARFLDVGDDGAGLLMKPPNQWVEEAGAFLRGQFAASGVTYTSRLLVAAPGARHATKIWPAEKWSELLNGTREAGWTSQVLVGDMADAPLAGEIISKTASQVLNLAGKTDLKTMIGLVSLAGAVVGGDSGPMHLAAALGRPVVAIFGPTVTEFGFAPFRCRSRVVQVAGIPCRPCHPHGPEKCPLDHFRCMRDISAEMVTQALQEVAAATPDPEPANQ